MQPRRGARAAQKVSVAVASSAPSSFELPTRSLTEVAVTGDSTTALLGRINGPTAVKRTIIIVKAVGVDWKCKAKREHRRIGHRDFFWFGDVGGSVKAIWTSQPDNIGTRVGMHVRWMPSPTGRVRHRAPPCLWPRTQPAVGQTENVAPDPRTQCEQPPLSLCPRQHQRPVNGSSANHVPMSTCPPGG